METNRSIEGKPTARKELMAAMMIYMLPIFSILATAFSLPAWLDRILLILFWGSVLFALGLAIFKGLPPWSLSYLGFF